ncbi:MAG: methylated-DNA--[protein]-cysteine S-methyltransferase [Ilumatobacteraceae bacterium]|jgi:methylated-DNA-[protein]-cysteine S-methyltransferase
MRYEVHRSLRTPVGVLRVTACERGVVAIDRVARATTSKQSHASRATSATVDASKLVRAQRHADVAVRQLREYFAGTRTRFSVPLHMEGTAFQKRAWRTMRKIPHGSTMSYAQQARAMGAPKAVRAVGSANGANPIPIIVPCHRVIASDGSLGGYALGLAMKRRLLALEQGS